MPAEKSRENLFYKLQMWHQLHTARLFSQPYRNFWLLNFSHSMKCITLAGLTSLLHPEEWKRWLRGHWSCPHWAVNSSLASRRELPSAVGPTRLPSFPVCSIPLTALTFDSRHQAKPNVCTILYNYHVCGMWRKKSSMCFCSIFHCLDDYCLGALGLGLVGHVLHHCCSW